MPTVAVSMILFFVTDTTTAMTSRMKFHAVSWVIIEVTFKVRVKVKVRARMGLRIEFG